MSLISKIELLKKEFFEPSKVKEVYQGTTNAKIIELLHAERETKSFPIVFEFVQNILNGSLYHDFLMTSDETIKSLIADPDESVRALISECIETHNYEIAQALAQLYKTKNIDVLLLVIQIIVRQMCDPESEVGLKAVRTLLKIFSPQQIQVNPELKQILKEEFLGNLLKTGLILDKDVISLRFMEATIHLSNIDQEIQESFVKQGIMQLVVQIYNTDDILVKLNAIELIQQLGNSEWNAKFLAQQDFFNELLSGAMNEKEEFYVRKYSIILLCKLIQFRMVQFNLQHQQSLSKLLLQWLFNGNSEEIEAGLQVFGLIASIKEGFDYLSQNEALVLQYFSFFRTQKEHIKLKFLASLQGVFKVDAKSPKQPNKIYSLYNLLVNQSQNYDSGTMLNSSKQLLKQLNLPIQDVEVQTLEVLQCLIIWREILRSFISAEQFIDYLVKYAQNKEIFDLKRLAIKDILYLCETETEQVFKTFAVNLRQRLENKPSEEMLVETKTD